MWIRLLLASCVVMAGLPSVVEACRCAAPPAPKTAAEKAAAVFAAKVKSVEKDEFQVKVTFDVALVWKGKVGATVAIHTASSGDACGYGFATGSEYLVYCYQDKEGMLRTNICTRTCSLADAKRDLEALGPGAMPMSSE